jgi:hypothetical protein
LKKSIKVAVSLALLFIFNFVSCRQDDGSGFTDEGSPEAPIFIGSAIGGLTSRNGQVGTGASFYYAAVADGMRYLVLVSDMSDDVDLFVYDSSFVFIGWSINPESQDESVIVTASGSSLHIKVMWYDGPDQGNSFNLTAAEQ